ncbi:MAG TPA: L-lactate permease [Methylomirabilota bacterium]|nr:L-lactate permease [Methylomirabilota bacterium]
MDAILAASPILVVLVLMLGFRLPAAHAGSSGLLLALYLASTREGALQGWAFIGPFVESAFLTGTILWILMPALAIYHLQTATGAIATIRDALSELTQNRTMLAILIGWFFALFLEGVAGFGTPVALGAPLLVGFGLAPVPAVAIALIGHASGVAFGAVGTPVLAQAELTGMAAEAIAAWTGPVNALLAATMIGFVVHAARAEDGSGRAALVWPPLAALLFLAPMAAIAAFVGPELPTIGGALIGVAAFALAVWWREGTVGAVTFRALAKAAAPYLAVIALILVTRLVPVVRADLEAVVWEWTWLNDFAGSFRPLFHPGTMLFAGLLVGAIIQQARLGEIGSALGAAAKRLVMVALALFFMLSLARVMLHSGMIDTLADAAATTTGPAWPLIAPAVGMLGSFVTGSATASNVLFTNLQATTASELGLPVGEMLAAQGVGAAVGNILSPLNVIAGAATVGLVGREGAIMRLTLPACLAGAIVVGVAVFVTTRL